MLTQWAHGHGDIQLQIDKINKKIQAHPRQAKLYLERASLQHHHEDHAAAERDFQKSLELDPNLHDAWMAWGIVDLGEGHAAEAEYRFSQYIEKVPKAGKPYWQRALARSKLGKKAEAAEDFRTAFKLIKVPELQMVLDASAVIAGPEGIRLLDAAIIQFGPKVAVLHETAAHLAALEGDWQQAISRLDPLKSAMVEPAWRLRRARVLKLAKKEGLAKKEAKEALKTFDSVPLQRRGSKMFLEMRKELEAF